MMIATNGEKSMPILVPGMIERSGRSIGSVRWCSTRLVVARPSVVLDAGNQLSNDETTMMIDVER